MFAPVIGEDAMTVLSPEDEGKFLMDVEAEQIGIVTEVDRKSVV